MTIGFDLGHDLDLEFSRSNIEFPISQPKMVRLPRNEKQTYRLNSRAQMWPSGLTLAMTLTLNFQGQIWNFLYLSQKCSDCHETKSKHIDWTLGLKCDHRVWPWPWPWPWIFKVKYQRLRNFSRSHQPKWPLLKLITSAIFTSHQSNLADVVFRNIGHFSSI